MLTTVYRFKVSLFGDRAQPIGKLHRIIDIEENAPFDLLHELIFEAFDRYDPHTYKFLLTRSQVKNTGELFDCKEEVCDLRFAYGYEEVIAHDIFTYTIAEAGLKEKDIIYYWFDFGDDWLHRLRVEKIFTVDDEPEEGSYIAEVMKKVGKSPEQYAEDSVWTEENEAFDRAKLMTVLSMLGGHNAQAMTWAELEKFGVAEIMLQAGLVKPAKRSEDKIKLTAEGKAKAEKLQELFSLLGQGG